MEAIPKSDIKSVIKSDIRFDISIKRSTWIGHKTNNNSENNNICSVSKTLHYFASLFENFTAISITNGHSTDIFPLLVNEISLPTSVICTHNRNERFDFSNFPFHTVSFD